MDVAEASWHVTCRPQLGRLPDAERQPRLEQRGVDPLAEAVAATREERREHPVSEVDPGRDVGHRRACLRRFAVGLPGHAHDPRHGLRDEVITTKAGKGARVTEAGQRCVDKPRVQTCELVVAHAQALRRSWPEVLHEDVSSPHEVVHRAPSATRPQVKGDGLLSSVQRRVRQADRLPVASPGISDGVGVVW